MKFAHHIGPRSLSPTPTAAVLFPPWFKACLSLHLLARLSFSSPCGLFANVHRRIEIDDKWPTYYCTRKFWPLSNNIANPKFPGADGRWPAKAAQVAYNCAHIVSGSSRQYDTISLLMLRPSPGEDDFKPFVVHVDQVHH